MAVSFGIKLDASLVNGAVEVIRAGEGLMSAVGNERGSYCSSCYTGRYPVEFPRDEVSYLQLALKLDKTVPVTK